MTIGGRLSLSLLLATVFAACAETGRPPDPLADEAAAAENAVADQVKVEEFFSIIGHCRDVLIHSSYIETFIETVVSTVSVDLEPPYDETAVLIVSLGPVGYVESLELKSVSSSIIEAPFQLFVEAPPSLPVAPRDVRVCLGAQPFPLVVKVFRYFRCEDEDEYLAYYIDVEQLLYKILYSPHYSSAPGRGWVRLDVTLGSEGQVRELKFHGKSDSLASTKLSAAIRQVGTFPPPPDFSRCFAEKPLPLRLDVQGELPEEK
jgi:hypothetical protein